MIKRLKRLIAKIRLRRWQRQNQHTLELAHVRQAQRFACTGMYNPNLTAVIEKLEKRRDRIAEKLNG